jgi:hypothetical protein
MAQPVCPSFGIPGAFPHLRFGRYALSVVCGIDDVADLHALIADMAVMIGDHAEATIGLGIGLVWTGWFQKRIAHDNLVEVLRRLHDRARNATTRLADRSRSSKRQGACLGPATWSE